MTVFIVFAIYICQSLRLIAATDCDSLEGKSATIVLEILGGLLTTAMAISCIFMYFLPNPNIFGVIAFSILSFGGIPGTITLLIVTSIYVV